MAKHPGRTALYRLYDQSDRLLYVGVSHKPDVRWGQHSEEKEWWPAVDRRAVEWHETRLEAERAEKTAITKERPLHNKAGAFPAVATAVGGKTPTRPIRVSLTTWAEFGEAAGTMGTDRSAALRGFMSWYLRKPGAELPERPLTTDQSGSSA